MISNDAQKNILINRSVYGLISLLVIVFVVIFFMLNYQQKEAGEYEDLINNYHLKSSEKSLELLTSVNDLRLWFRDYHIYNNLNVSKADKRSAAELINMEFAPRDKIESFNYEIGKTIREITLIHEGYYDSEFSRINLLLKQAYTKVKLEFDALGNKTKFKYKNIDKTINPLVSVADQFRLLHKHAYHEKHKRLESLKQSQRTQLVFLIFILSLLGVYGVFRMLNLVNNTLLDLTKIKKEVEYSEARFRSIFESMLDAVVMTNAERKIVLVNSAVKKYLVMMKMN